MNAAAYCGIDSSKNVRNTRNNSKYLNGNITKSPFHRHCISHKFNIKIKMKTAQQREKHGTIFFQISPKNHSSYKYQPMHPFPFRLRLYAVLNGMCLNLLSPSVSLMPSLSLLQCTNIGSSHPYHHKEWKSTNKVLITAEQQP